MAWIKKKSTPNAGADDLAPHASVVKADPYSFQVAHRRLAWLLRISAGTNIVLGFCLIVTVNGLVEIAPMLSDIKVALVRSDAEDNRTYRIEPLNKTVEGFDLVLESKARRYPWLVLTIDRVTHKERIREAARMSEKNFFERLKDERQKKINDALANGLTRTITVESVDRIQTYDGTYKFAVDLLQTDTRRGELVETSKRRVYLSMTTIAQDKVKEEDKYENPLGITVLDMTLHKRGNS